MKPLVRDEDGKLRNDLPKPAGKDDAKKANAAVADWKLLKKQIREVGKIQAQRLEQAMVIGRTWPVDQFETLLVRHPLMTNLIRLLVWGGLDDKGELLATFRVTEEQEYADDRDEPLTLAKAKALCIVHPLHLSEQQKGRWGEIFGDYEIIPPSRNWAERRTPWKRTSTSSRRSPGLKNWSSPRSRSSVHWIARAGHAGCPWMEGCSLSIPSPSTVPT